jgi:hypothetical protein
VRARTARWRRRLLPAPAVARCLAAVASSDAPSSRVVRAKMAGMGTGCGWGGRGQYRQTVEWSDMVWVDELLWGGVDPGAEALGPRVRRGRRCGGVGMFGCDHAGCGWVMLVASGLTRVGWLGWVQSSGLRLAPIPAFPRGRGKETGAAGSGSVGAVYRRARYTVRAREATWAQAVRCIVTAPETFVATVPDQHRKAFGGLGSS